jgi:hypothetical protein
VRFHGLVIAVLINYIRNHGEVGARVLIYGVRPPRASPFVLSWPYCCMIWANTPSRETALGSREQGTN